MPDAEIPQIYLISPPVIDLSSFTPLLQRMMDQVDVACFRLDVSSKDERTIALCGDAIREICHQRDIPVVIADHPLFVERLGLDGVHLSDGPRNVRALRKELGSEAIVGAFCGASRHDGLNAGESGADYVSFGPVGESALGMGERADIDLFSWWSEMIEVPIVAEGNLDQALVKTLANTADFLAFGEEIWAHDDPVAALVDYANALARVDSIV